LKRKPDYILKAKPEGEESWQRVGVAWKNGSLRVHLDLGVILRWDDGLILRLFQNEHD